MSTPVVLLAFANDKSQPDRFLAQLKAEKEGILAHLTKISHLCEVEIVEDTDINRLMDAFQRIGNRLAIFHFAGHAGSFHLCLESSDGKAELAHGSGLARFLGLQPNLQLVFLNGCSTQKQADLLLAEGVPAIIATSQLIKDKVAKDLSINFFHSLSKGDGLFTAFQESVASVQIRHGDQHRNLFYEEQESNNSRFPWDLYVRPGAERIYDWNLPSAANNPLFELPALKDIYPSEPYRYLEWFREEDAQIFFGRSFQIRALYEKIRVKPQQRALEAQAKAKGWEGSSALQDPPVIHLYGRSGVGKSSLLAAGLSPRLKQDHQIKYLRRSQEYGLLGTLLAGLGAAEAKDIFQAWQKVEAEHKRPLIVFLDQGEEVFTRPLRGTIPSQEWREFLAVVKKIFFGPEPLLKGKLVLSYRKEYLAEIEEAFKLAALPWQKVFLQRLKLPDIIDAVEGISREEGCKAQYKLSIEQKGEREKTLAQQIADDLLQDPESPVAPMLQILLSKMWRKAKETDSQNPQFTYALYRQFQQNGLGMEDFLHQQLKSLEAEESERVQSGLVLDLLNYHTTPLGTATKRTFKELRAAFPILPATFQKLLTQLKTRYLLIDPQQNNTTRLAHDTLAPLVQRRFDESNAVGQQSVRVLRNQLVLNRESQRPRPLDKDDLKIINNGRRGRRNFNQAEQHLYLCSQILASPRVIAPNRDQALAAWQIKADSLSEQAIRQAFHNSFFYRQSAPGQGILSCGFSPNGQWLLLAYAEHDALICDLSGKPLFSLPQSEAVIQMRWNQAGDRVLLLQENGTLSLWDLRQKHAQGIALSPKLEVDQGIGSYASNRGSGKGGRQKSRFLLHDFAFNATETGILVFHPEAGPQLYDLQGGLQSQYKKQDKPIAFALFIPQHNRQFVVLEKGDVVQAFIDSDKHDKLDFAFEDQIRDGYWSAASNKVVLLTRKHLWQVEQNAKPEVKAILSIEQQRLVAPASAEDEFLIAGDKESKIIQTPSQVSFALQAEDLKRVEELQMSPDGSRVAALRRGELFLWDLSINHLSLQKRLERGPKHLQYLSTSQKLLIGDTKQLSLYRGIKDNRPQTWRPSNRVQISAAALSPSGSHLAYGDEFGNLELISLDGERSTLAIKGVTIDEIMSFATEFNYRSDSIQPDEFPSMPDPKLMMEAQDPMEVIRSEIKGHWGEVASLAFLSDGEHFVSAGQDWSIKLWNLQGQKLYETPGMQSMPNLDALRGEDATQLQQQTLVQQDPFANANMALSHIIGGPSHSSPIKELIVRPSRNQVISIDENRLINLFDIDSKKLDEFPAKAKKGVFSPSGERLYLLDIDQLSCYQFVEAPQLLWKADLPIGEAQSIAVSPSGERLALGTREGLIFLYQSDGSWQGEFQTEAKAGVELLKWIDDYSVIVGQSDRKIRFISWDTDKALRHLRASQETEIVGIKPVDQGSQKRGGQGSGSARSR
ncbi:MAG: CHAT domain-containing protein [Bacteroidota bacterium]